MRKPKKYLVKVEGENRSGSTTMAAVDPIYEGELNKVQSADLTCDVIKKVAP